MGCKSNEKVLKINVKKYIMELLERSKAGEDPKTDELETVLSNIEEMDHHDFVRTDQILTRMQNKMEKEAQWGSVIMNCKWKML